MDLKILFEFIIILLFGLLALRLLVFRIIEPIYVFIFKKPLFLYVYPLLKKLDDGQKQILEKNFPFYNRLTFKKRRYFEHRVKEFVSKYEFVGKDVEITQTMEMLIAGTYVMLTFGLRKYLINLFLRVIVYPSSYYSSSNDAYHKGEFNPQLKTIVFSWEDFVLGHATSNDNINLGLHEFAHALHFHCLKSNDSSAVVFQDEFNKLMRYYNDENLNAELRSKGYFRLYAYQNQFEFLAVILEHFFETPSQFKKEHSELFTIVKDMLNFKESFD